ncbi:MAG: PDZ domain-containing protein, partial [Candidatus Electryoneaceae bacterium]|nr:PDZ domain-containing protein [Candidatus Electryoneaceae bacterium]
MKTGKILTVLLMVFLFTTVGAEDSPRPFMGINHQPVKELPLIDGSPSIQGGVLITHVQQDSPADSAGLLTGDILVGIDGNIFDCPTDSISEKFRELLFVHRPGDEMRLTIFREEIIHELLVNGVETAPGPYLENPAEFIAVLPDGSDIMTTAHKEWVVKELVIVLGSPSGDVHPPLPEFIETDLARIVLLADSSNSVDWKTLSFDLAKRYDMERDFYDLLKRLRNVEAGDDGTRLPMIAAVHRNPFLLERLGRQFTGRLMTQRIKLVKDMFCSQDVAVYLTGDHQGSDTNSFASLPDDAGEEQFIAWFETQIDDLTIVLGKAYASLNSEEMEHLSEYMVDLTDAFAEHIYIHIDE